MSEKGELVKRWDIWICGQGSSSKDDEGEYWEQLYSIGYTDRQKALQFASDAQRAHQGYYAFIVKEARHG